MACTIPTLPEENVPNEDPPDPIPIYGVLRLENSGASGGTGFTVLQIDVDSIHHFGINDDSFAEIAVLQGTHSITGTWTLYASGIDPREYQINDSIFVPQQGITWAYP